MKCWMWMYLDVEGLFLLNVNINLSVEFCTKMPTIYGQFYKNSSLNFSKIKEEAKNKLKSFTCNHWNHLNHSNPVFLTITRQDWFSVKRKTSWFANKQIAKHKEKFFSLFDISNQIPFPLFLSNQIFLRTVYRVHKFFRPRKYPMTRKV